MNEQLKIRTSIKLAEISAYFLDEYKRDFRQNKTDLFTSRGGTIILQSLLCRTSSNELIRKELQENIAFIIDSLENTEVHLSSFCNGLSGIGWLFCYLHDEGFLEGKVDIDQFLEDFDGLLEQQLPELLQERNFDLMHGALGIGLYFLKRNKHKQVGEILQRLSECAEEDGAAIMWRKFDAYKINDFIYDLGLAHGNAGILHFLSKCYMAGIELELSHRLMKGSIKFYTTVIQDHEKYNSFFPSALLIKEYESKEQRHCRLAWCYGDIGVLYTLLSAADILGDKQLKYDITAMMKKTATRTTPLLTGVKDAGFCHGASGVAYLFMKSFHKTGEQTFKQAADFWVEQCLQMSYHKDGVRGYKFHMGEQQWQIMSDMICGVGGVAALYLSYLYPDIQSSWDEMFFLS